MATDANEEVIRAVTSAIQARPGISMDDLILSCRPHTWNQVFLTLDALTRVGVVRLHPHGGFYAISPSLQPIAERHQDQGKKPSVRRVSNPYPKISRTRATPQPRHQAGNPAMM
jgi:hypothetical protein